MHLPRVPRSLKTAPTANDVGTRARDARVARALDAVNEWPAAPWTVAKLAKVAGLSRAAFARRFKADVGSSPLRHVTMTRLYRAAGLLLASDAALAVVAAEVGYATEFSLSRAFRRHVGQPPGLYRRRVLVSGSSPAPRCRAA